MSEIVDRQIATKPTASVEQGIAWAKKMGAAQLMIDLAPRFWEIATLKGINPVFTYCQTAYETGYMNFKGTLLDASYKNTAGIKKSDEEIKRIMAKYPNETSSDRVAECHTKFASWEDSIDAQIDHSALYAGLSGYPKKYPEETNDPRHFDWCFGIGKTVLAWAPNYSTNAYGERLIEMMTDVEKTVIPENGTPQVNITLAELRSGMYQDSPYTNQVKSMQQLLIAKGFDCGPKGADGSFGISTENALKAFQVSRKIGADGICGRKTWPALLGV
jgi:hypothetical protein